MTIKRRSYFVSPSIQIKYILMSVLPALIVGVYATILLFKTAELLLVKEEGKVLVSVSSQISNLGVISKGIQSVETKRAIVEISQDLYRFQRNYKRRSGTNLRYLNEIKNILLLGEVLISLCVGILALVYSHRIAGPMFRISKYMKMLSEGKDIPPVKVRYYDEFKDVADLLDKLREKLREKQ